MKVAIVILGVAFSTLLLSCSVSKAQYAGECRSSIDTTIVIVNTTGLDKAGLFEFLNKLSGTHVSVVGLSLDSPYYNINVFELDGAISRFEGKIVVGLNDEQQKPFKATPLVLYADDNQNVAGFSFNFTQESKELKETFYLQMLNSIDHSRYSNHKQDSMVYAIDYTGDKNCFLVMDHAVFDHLKKEYLINKVVLVGDTGESFFISGLIDSTYAVPVPLYNRDGSYFLMNKTLIHANILSTILRKPLVVKNNLKRIN